MLLNLSARMKNCVTHGISNTYFRIFIISNITKFHYLYCRGIYEKCQFSKRVELFNYETYLHCYFVFRKVQLLIMQKLRPEMIFEEHLVSSYRGHL